MRTGTMVVLSVGLLVAGACGGDDDDAADEVDLEAGDDAAESFDLGTLTEGDLDITIPDLFGDLEFEETPGQIRFLSLLSEGGTPQALDFYWGGPNAVESTEPFATSEYGVATEYLTPMRPVDQLLDSGDIVFTATKAGTDEVVFSWDRFLPDPISRFVVLFRYEPDGEINMSDLDEAQPNFTQFPDPPAGQVSISFNNFGSDLIGPSGDTMGMMGDGRCLSNGTNVLDETGHPLPGDVRSIPVPPGVELTLHYTEIALDPDESEPHFECIGEPLSEPVTTPSSGKALVIATTAPDGEPGLVVVPVAA